MSNSVFIYGYKRAPFNQLDDYLSRIHPGASLTHLVNNYFENAKDFQIEDLTHFIFANANDISVGKNFTERFAKELNLNRTKVKAFRFDQEHMSVFKGLELLSDLTDNNLTLLTAYENITSFPDYMRNSFIQARPETKQEEKKEVIKGMLHGFTYVDEYQQDIWEIIQAEVAKNGISKDDCDKYAFTSRYKYIESFNKGWFKNEILSLIYSEQEQQLKFELDLLGSKYYSKEEYINAPALTEETPLCSRLNVATPVDGSALLLASSQRHVDKTPRLEIVDFDFDYSEPNNFITLGAESMKRICERNNLQVGSLDFYEMHESHAGVILAQAKILDIPSKRINIRGGSIAIGDPISVTGARLITSACSLVDGSKEFITGLINISSPFGTVGTLLVKRPA